MLRASTVAVSALILASCGAAGDAAPPAGEAPAESAVLGAADTASLQTSVARLATAWNAGSGPQWAAEYWSDGELVNILGVRNQGAPAVAAVTAKILAGPFAGSHYAYTVRSIRLLSGTAALVETDVDVTNFRALPPGAAATQPGLLQTRMTHVYERRGSVWHVLLSQNTAVTPAAPAPPG